MTSVRFSIDAKALLIVETICRSHVYNMAVGTTSAQNVSAYSGQAVILYLCAVNILQTPS